eukprot:5647-Heterococcus_DN1.PRE.1
MQLRWWIGIATTVFCILATCLQVLGTSEGGGCPNLCSGNGVCTNPTLETCACYEGWVGFACSGRACPSGAAWADKATADNIAHAPLTECSSFGYCNRATGVCECKDGYSGEACQRKLCPGNGNCSGHGRCISVAQAGIQQDYRSL